MAVVVGIPLFRRLHDCCPELAIRMLLLGVILFDRLPHVVLLLVVSILSYPRCI